MANYFVSYTKSDKRWAEWIAWQLEDAGHTAKVQLWDFPPGANFVHEMHRATEGADRTVLVLTPEFLDSRFAAAEWYAAFVEDPLGEKRKLLPIRVKECDPTGLLGQIVYCDLVGLNVSDASALLRSATDTTTRGKPPQPPEFPGGAESSGAAPCHPAPRQPPFPPSVQQTWKVPHRRNPDFTGRAEILDLLEQTLSKDGEATVVQAVHGLGGVGKTEVAIEYAYRHRENYDLIWWIRAEQVATLAAGFAELAADLGLAEVGSADQAATVTAVLRWLEQTDKHWLLIFDNSQEYSELQGFLPERRGGHVLITSRNRTWPRQVGRIDLNVLAPAESVQFLEKRSVRGGKEGLDDLAAELGHLPLALEQAAAYIDERGIGCAGYLSRFRQHRDQLLRLGKPQDYPWTVATTWELSFLSSAEQAPLSTDLMNLLAYLAPDAVPMDLLLSNGIDLPETLANAVSDPVVLDEAVMALRRHSLVDVLDDDSLSVHRLVQFVARDRMSDRERKSWSRIAVSVVNSAFPDRAEDVLTWPVSSRLLLHSLVVAQHATEEDSGVEQAGQLLNRAGRYLYGRALMSEARTALEDSLKVRERVLGSDHPDVAHSLNDLAIVLHDYGDPRATEYWERALRIREVSLEADDPDLAMSLANLGLALGESGQTARAQELLERAVEIRERVLGPEHADTAHSLGNLGGIYQQQQNYEEAKRLVDRALRIREETQGPNHPDYGATLAHLAMIHKEMRNLKLARSAAQRSVDILEQSLGPDHPGTVVSIHILAEVLAAEGEKKASLGLHKRGYEVRLNAFGMLHRSTIASYTKVADAMRQLGDLTGAQELFEQARQVTEQSFPDDKANLAVAISNLATIVRENGDAIRARSLFEECLNLQLELFARNDHRVLMTMLSLSEARRDLGAWSAARSMAQEALTAFRRLKDAKGESDALRLIREIGVREREKGRRQ